MSSNLAFTHAYTRSRTLITIRTNTATATQAKSQYSHPFTSITIIAKNSRDTQCFFSTRRKPYPRIHL